MMSTKIHECVNCKVKPVTTTEDVEAPYKFKLMHKKQCYPTYCLETHQLTEKECIDEWNEFNRSHKR
jgi:hypothetical protein